MFLKNAGLKGAFENVEKRFLNLKIKRSTGSSAFGPTFAELNDFAAAFLQPSKRLYPIFRRRQAPKSVAARREINKAERRRRSGAQFEQTAAQTAKKKAFFRLFTAFERSALASRFGVRYNRRRRNFLSAAGGAEAQRRRADLLR